MMRLSAVRSRRAMVVARLETRRLAAVEADVPLTALDRAMHGDREVEDRRAAGIEAAGCEGLLTKNLEILQGAKIGAERDLVRLGLDIPRAMRLQLDDVAHDTLPRMEGGNKHRSRSFASGELCGGWSRSAAVRCQPAFAANCVVNQAAAGRAPRATAPDLDAELPHPLAPTEHMRRRQNRVVVSDDGT